jgi:hypothetical protein
MYTKHEAVNSRFPRSFSFASIADLEALTLPYHHGAQTQHDFVGCPQFFSDGHDDDGAPSFG